MKRLFSKHQSEADIRPALLSMSALMMILLPTLLLVTTPQKLIGIPLSIAGATTELPPTPSGIIEGLRVEVIETGFHIEAKVRRSDVLASAGDLEEKNWSLPSWERCIEQLKTIKTLDENRQRITLSPAKTSTTSQVIHWMDSLQSADLYPEVILESQP